MAASSGRKKKKSTGVRRVAKKAATGAKKVVRRAKKAAGGMKKAAGRAKKAVGGAKKAAGRAKKAAGGMKKAAGGVKKAVRGAKKVASRVARGAKKATKRTRAVGATLETVGELLVTGADVIDQATTKAKRAGRSGKRKAAGKTPNTPTSA